MKPNRIAQCMDTAAENDSIANKESHLELRYGTLGRQFKSITAESEPMSHFGTGRRKKRKYSKRDQSKQTLDDIAVGDEKTSSPSYSILNESCSEDHSFGLSDNLSTESIKKACGFYEDELSDDDLIEVQSTPECFQKKPFVRRSFKVNRFNIDSGIRRKDSEDNPLCALSSTIKDAQTSTDDCRTEEAIDVLNELDAILDVHDTSELDISNSSGLEMHTKIEDCLLDLDNYLDKMDECSVINDDKDEISQSSEERPLKKLTKNRRNRTFPKNRKLGPISIDSDEKSIDEMLQRGNCLRKSISCIMEGRIIGERNPRTLKLENVKDFTLPENFANQEAARENNISDMSGDLGVDLEHEINVAETYSRLHNVEEQTLPLNSELRRCFSQNDFSTRISSSNASETLTSDDIIQNILVQNESNQTGQNRPRQFGRRAEGHPRIISIRSEVNGADNTSYTIVNYDRRPMSAPATATIRSNENVLQSERQSTVYIGSEASSTRSSRNPSPITVISSTDSSSTAVSANGNIETNLVTNESLPHHNSQLDPENSQSNVQPGFNSEWPHSFSRTLALLCCTLGLFNICRFAVLTANYGGNFLLQFLLLSIIFGIPFFWLQMCLGAKIKYGPVSMWKISPICRGIGIALAIVQCCIAIYSTVAIAWLLVYLRDSFPTKVQTSPYRWQEAAVYRQTTNGTNNLTEYVSDYFNIAVLQRLQFIKRTDGSKIRFLVSDRLAFNLALLWAAVFLILCKGLKSLGKVLLVLFILPLIALVVITCKLLFIMDPSKIQNIFTTADFDEFLVNSKTWAAAAQEAFLTWGLLGSSVIAVTSRIYIKGNTKSTLRRDALLVTLITLLGLSIAALLGLICMQILNQHSYFYVPGSFEQPDSSKAIFSLRSSISTEKLSYAPKWVPHYSSVVGEIYRRPVSLSHHESGYQALRFISELFPAAIALSSDSVSWVWTAVAFTMFILFGLAQLCVMWKPISSALGDSTSSVLLSCVTGLLLSIPFATEVGLPILHYMDSIFGGSWFIPILWTAQIFGVFLIRGRPYNGDDLVNDLKMTGSMSAFLALSWNVLLPIGMITLSIVEYRISLSNQFFYWRGKSYFSYWARKVAGLTQIGFLLLVPIIAIIQIYRYLSNGPPDILDRIQLLYRPPEGGIENRRELSRSSENNNGRLVSGTNINLNSHRINDDAPPKYTPPPSYTTATGARLAKILRQSIRRSVRRILGDSGRPRPVLSIDTEMNHQSLPPDYSNVLTNPAGIAEEGEQLAIDALANDQRSSRNTYSERSTSLGRKALSQKQRWDDANPRRPSTAPRATERNSYLQRPYTAEDVVTVLRSSTRTRPGREQFASCDMDAIQPPVESSFCSIENLILNAEPLGQSAAVVELCSTDDNSLNNEQNNTSVI